MCYACKPLITELSKGVTIKAVVLTGAIMISVLALCEFRDLKIQWQNPPEQMLTVGQHKVSSGTSLVSQGLIATKDLATLVWTGEKPVRQVSLVRASSPTSALQFQPKSTRGSQKPFWAILAALSWVMFWVVHKFYAPPNPTTAESAGGAQNKGGK